MTDENITQIRLIESAQRKIQEQIAAVARSLAWYRRYPRVYGPVISELMRQRDDYGEALKRLQEQLMALLKPNFFEAETQKTHRPEL